MDKAKQIKISELKLDPRNANKGTKRGSEMLKQSLQELGAGRSVLCDKNGVVIAGNKTITAASKTGISNAIVVETDGKQVVVVKRTDLDLSLDEKAKKLAIADNRVGQISLEFNPEILAEIKEEVDLSNLFTSEELTELLQSANQEPEGEQKEDEEEVADLIDEAESGEIESRVKPGEVWKLGRHFIACADCTVEANIRKLLGFVGDRTPDMVWADPPYGISIVATNVSVGGGEAYNYPFGGVKNKKDKGLGSIGGAKPFGSKKDNIRGSDRASNIVPVGKYAPIVGDETLETAIKSTSAYLGLFPKALHCWWGGNYYSAHLPNSSCWIVWDKQNTGNFADAELAWTNSNSAVRIFQHMWNGMLKDSERGERRVHPTQKPCALFSYFIDKYGKSQDLIIDPFLGSGISVIGSQQSDRTVVGFELSREYSEIVIRRWEALSGEVAELVGRID